MKPEQDQSENYGSKTRVKYQFMSAIMYVNTNDSFDDMYLI